MGVHRSMVMVMAWVGVQIRRKMLGSGGHAKIAIVVATNMPFTYHVLTRPSSVYMEGMTSNLSTGGAY